MNTNVKAGFGKRFIALFLDFTLFAILFYVCFTFIAEPIANNANQIIALRQEYLDLGKFYGIVDPESPIFQVIVEKDAPEYLAFLQNPRTSELETLITLTNMMEICISGFLPSVLLYFVIPLLLRNGQTLGKKFVSIEVVRVKDLELRWHTMLLRMIAFYLVEFCLSIILFGIPLVLSICIAVFSERRQTLHDFISGTYVIEGQGAFYFKDAEQRIEFFKKAKGK